MTLHDKCRVSPSSLCLKQYLDLCFRHSDFYVWIGPKQPHRQPQNPYPGGLGGTRWDPVPRCRRVLCTGLYLWSGLGCLFKLVANKTRVIFTGLTICQLRLSSFFFKHSFFHFWAWIKKKKENRWRGTWTTRNVRINDRRTIDPRWAIDTDTVNSLKGLHTLQLCWFFGPGKINKKYAEEPVNSPWPGWLGESIEWPGGTQSVLYKLPHRSHTKP